MKKWIALMVFFMVGVGYTAHAQYTGPDRYFYEEEFDWRWDVRVRISDGYRMGYLTRRQANRLYKRLEAIERKEWAFQSDGYYDAWEQDEIWYDIQDLHRVIGIELTDWDRRYYGYTGLVIRGPLRWYFGTSYDFYRFDRRGFGTIYIGYTPRNYYPVKNVYYTKVNNYYVNWNTAPVVTNRTSRTATESIQNRRDASTTTRTARTATPAAQSRAAVAASGTGSATTGTTSRSAVSRSAASTPTTGSTARATTADRAANSGVGSSTGTPAGSASRSTVSISSRNAGSVGTTSRSTSSTARSGSAVSSKRSSTGSPASSARTSSSVSSRSTASSSSAVRSSTSRSTSSSARTAGSSTGRTRN